MTSIFWDARLINTDFSDFTIGGNVEIIGFNYTVSHVLFNSNYKVQPVVL
jgi:hypothetical protein